WTVPETENVIGNYRFTLRPADGPLRAGKPGDLLFDVTQTGGGAVRLEPVMDAYAHLVAFDLSRSGFAHLHPKETDLTVPLDPVQPQLSFQISIPKPGRYIVWAQVSLEGEERFVPFAVPVVP